MVLQQLGALVQHVHACAVVSGLSNRSECHQTHLLQHGIITRQSQEQLDIRSIQNAFAEAMHQNPGTNCFVAVAYYRQGKPKLLRRHAFTELCNALEQQTHTIEGSRSLIDVPDVIQVCTVSMWRAAVLVRWYTCIVPATALCVCWSCAGGYSAQLVE